MSILERQPEKEYSESYSYSSSHGSFHTSGYDYDPPENYDELLAQYNRLVKDFDELKRTHEEALQNGDYDQQQKLNQLYNENRSLQASYIEYRKRSLEASELVRDMNETFQEIIATLTEATGKNISTVDDIMDTIKSLSGRNRITDLTSQLKDARSEVLELKNSSPHLIVEELKGKLDDAENRNKNCRVQLEEASNKMKNLEQNNLTLTKKLAKVVEENQELKARMKQQTAPSSPKRAPVKKQIVKKGIANSAIANKNAQIANLETRIRELQYDLQVARDDLHESESSILSDNSAVSESILCQGRVIESLEAIVTAQSEEIKTLFDQRAVLLNLSNTYEQNVETAENEIAAMKTEIQNLNSAIEAEREMTQKETKKGELAMQNVLDSILTVLPPEVSASIQEIRDLPYSAQIIELFGITIGELEAAKVRSQKNIQDAKINLVTAQLENAIRFLSTLSANSSKTPIAQDGDFMLQINKQIKQLQDFVDTLPESERVPSVFEAHDSEAQIKAFIDLAGDSISQTPVRELFALFTAVSTVGKMMHARIKQLESFKAESSEAKNQIKKLKSQIKSKTSANEKIASKLAEVVNEPSDNLEDMIDQLISMYYKSESLRTKDSDDLRLLKKDVDQMEQHIEESKKYKRLIFYLKKDKAKLSEQLEDVKAELKQKEEKLNTKIDRMAREIRSASEDTFRIVELEKKAEQLVEARENEKNLDFKCRELEAQISKLTSELENSEHKNELLNDDNEKLKSKNDTLSKQTTLTAKKNKKLTKEIAALKKQNERILEDIKNRNENLSQKLDVHIQDMQGKVNRMSEKLQHAEEIRDKALGQKKDFQRQIAQLKAINHTANIKLEEMDAKTQLIQKQYAAEYDAMKLEIQSRLDKELREVEDFMLCCCNRLVQILESTFEINIKGEIDLWDITNIIEEQFHYIGADELARISHENAETRSILGCKKSDSMAVIATEMRNNFEECMANMEVLQQHNDQLQRSVNDITDEKNRYFECAKKVDEWEEWARRLYQSQTGGATSKDYRRSIEEIILAGRGNTTVERKLAVLRMEKKLLHDKRQSAVINTPIKEKPKSLRPLIVNVMFIRRLQNYSGTTPFHVHLFDQ